MPRDNAWERPRQSDEGRLRRREFVKRLTAFGLSASAVTTFLAACGATNPAVAGGGARATATSTTAPATTGATAVAPAATATVAPPTPSVAATRPTSAATAPAASRAATPPPVIRAAALPATPPLAPSACFPETGRCVQGLFYAYWREHGALERQGLPLTDEFDEVSPADGKTYRVQYFERARFEYHPELLHTPAVVSLGLIGREQFTARYPQGRPPSTPNPSAGEVWFQETGRGVGSTFYQYWERTGGLAQHGYPLSDAFDEVNPSDGKRYRVQYFERARFEEHPENAGTPNEVLLGLLGREQFLAKYPNGQPPAASGPAINVWAATRSGIDPKVASLPPRVYVPHELGASVAVIDPATFTVIDRYPVGRTPHHVAPAWDLSRLYVNNMDSSTLTEIDIQTGKPTGTVSTPVPYNLYFTPDGTKAIVAAEPINSLDFYDRQSWRLLKRVRINGAGVDHLDLSADGQYLLVSCEFDGQVFKVDTAAMAVVGVVRVGGYPIDIKLAPDGAVFYVANQARHGVSVVDPVAPRELEFLPTGRGAHGLAISRDTTALYVSNRIEGSISVVEFATRKIVATWNIGGSPDMLQVSPDGSQLWASGRWHGEVYVIDTRTGTLLRSIPTGPGPHGLTYFPQPGRFSLGHNGVYR